MPLSLPLTQTDNTTLFLFNNLRAPNMSVVTLLKEYPGLFHCSVSLITHKKKIPSKNMK